MLYMINTYINRIFVKKSDPHFFSSDSNWLEEGEYKLTQKYEY